MCLLKPEVNKTPSWKPRQEREPLKKYPEAAQTRPLRAQGNWKDERPLRNPVPLKVKQLRTSIFHPQTDGLVERFNKILKQMLKKAIDVDGKNWDQLLPYVLFSVREVPQSSTGFSPFELLYGRRPRGMLDLAKES